MEMLNEKLFILSQGGGGGGGLSFMTNIKWLPHKIQMLKSNFESVAQSLSCVVYLFQISENLAKCMTYKMSRKLWFLP